MARRRCQPMLPTGTHVAAIGKSLVIEGEVSGSESLYIDGKIEGSINLPRNPVTIDSNGQVHATGHVAFPLSFAGKQLTIRAGSGPWLTPRFGLATAKGATDAVALLSTGYGLSR